MSTSSTAFQLRPLTAHCVTSRRPVISAYYKTRFATHERGILRFLASYVMLDALSPDPGELRAPGSINVLNSRVRQYATRYGLDVRRLNQRICTEVMFGTLERAKNAGIIDLYLAKGGMALEIRFGVHARASRDLDIGILSGGADLVALFDRVLTIGFDEFTLERPRDVRILENVSTYRFSVKIKYKRQPFGTLEVDLNEDSYETAVTIEQTAFLTALGLPGPLDVPLLDPYLQLAQKLHGATEPDRADYKNNRYRDILDVLVIASSDKIDLDFVRLRSVVTAEFARRPHHTSWLPIVAIPEAWHVPLAVEAATLGLSDHEAQSVVRSFIAFIARIEGVSVRPTHEYQFLSLQMNLTGKEVLTEQKIIDEKTADGWRIIYIAPRQGYVDQMFAILERAIDEQRTIQPPLPRLQLRIENQHDFNMLALKGMLRNESPLPANRVRVFVTGIDSIHTFGTITERDGDFEVIFRLDGQPLLTALPPFPAVFVQYATDDGTKVEQIGRLRADGPDASGRYSYSGEGLGPSAVIAQFAHRHDPLEDL